jgi:hypothetical protein
VLAQVMFSRPFAEFDPAPRIDKTAEGGLGVQAHNVSRAYTASDLLRLAGVRAGR